MQAASTELAPGVWHVAGGSHHSVVVEFAEYLAVVEAPLDEARSQAVIAEARRLAPNKPIRYALTTHHHFDHTGGLRTYVAEGATVVTHASNVAYFEKTLTAPATLVARRAGSKDPQKPMLEGVSDKFEIDRRQAADRGVRDQAATPTRASTRSSTCRDPEILIEGDAYSPGPPDAAPPATPPPNAVTLDDAIRSLKLNVRTIAPIHGRGAVPIAELRRFIGRT